MGNQQLQLSKEYKIRGDIMSETVLLTFEGKTATITLNRPESMNAMDIELLHELSKKLNLVKQSDASILILTGEGKAFSAGGDIKTMLQQSDEDGFGVVMETIKDIMVTLYTLPLITVSAINGAAAGLGLSFALASDYVVAHEKAKVAMNFIGVGLIPDGGGHFFLQKRIGEVKAKQLIWEGKKLTADQALNIGLIDEVVSDDFKEALKTKIHYLQNAPIKAMIETKLIYAIESKKQLETILDLEKQGQQKMRKTKDHQEGIKAFLEKRAPNFKGE
jgi:2-(1,2-epoxy-1,2-dihydrophenyl)acetyl-CoA isomerase